MPSPKRIPNKIQTALKRAELETVDPEAYKLRCKLEGQRYREIKTYKDIVDLGEWAINCLISGEKDVKTVCAIGYMSVVSLQAIKLAKTEANPDQQLSEKLRLEQLKLNLTEAELKSLVNSTNLNVQINILNKAVERPIAPAETVALAQEYLGADEIHDIPGILGTALRNAGKLASGLPDRSDAQDPDALDIVIPESLTPGVNKNKEEEIYDE